MHEESTLIDDILGQSDERTLIQRLTEERDNYLAMECSLADGWTIMRDRGEGHLELDQPETEKRLAHAKAKVEELTVAMKKARGAFA